MRYAGNGPEGGPIVGGCPTPPSSPIFFDRIHQWCEPAIDCISGPFRHQAVAAAYDKPVVPASRFHPLPTQPVFHSRMVPEAMLHPYSSEVYPPSHSKTLPETPWSSDGVGPSMTPEAVPMRELPAPITLRQPQNAPQAGLRWQ